MKEELVRFLECTQATSVESQVNWVFFVAFFIILLFSLILNKRKDYLIAITAAFVAISPLFNFMTFIEQSGLPAGISITDIITIIMSDQLILTILIFIIVMTEMTVITLVVGLVFFEEEGIRESFRSRVHKWGKWKTKLGFFLAYMGAMMAFAYPMLFILFTVLDPGMGLADNPIFILMYSLPLYRFSFFAFFMSGLVSGGELRDADRTKKSDIVKSVLIIFSLVLVFMEIFGIAIRWPFLYYGVFYFGFFFIFQMIIYGNILRKLERKLIALELMLGLMTTFFIFENVDIFPGFPSELALYVSLLFTLGFLGAFRYRKEKTTITTPTETLAVDEPIMETREPQDEFSSSTPSSVEENSSTFKTD